MWLLRWLLGLFRSRKVGTLAALSDSERHRVHAHFMRRPTGTVSALKPDLRAAVDATDTWIDTNQASFNLALPVGVRGTLTADQKTLLFCYVAMRRAGLLRVEEDG